jgi:hypothetical protein
MIDEIDRMIWFMAFAALALVLVVAYGLGVSVRNVDYSKDDNDEG